MEQGTNEWLEWRRKGIGASEVPILMGESDFATPYQLWERKTGRAKEQESNFAMQRGIDAEPKIRALYEIENDIPMPATLVVHPDLQFCRSSLDGYNEEARRVLEIKYPGAEKHAQAVSGVVPECYYGQVQFQLFVTGAMRCDYVSFDGEKIAVVQVAPDAKYWERMIPTVTKFWKEHIEKDSPPELTDRDFKLIRDKETVDLFKAYKEHLAAKKAAEEQLEALREKIVAAVPHQRARCAGLVMYRTEAKGTVDYDKILKTYCPQVDKEQFRKKSSIRVTIKEGAE